MSRMPASRLSLFVGRSGETHVVGHANEAVPVAESLGPCVVRRASHVVPLNFWLRLAFRVVRAICRDDSATAAWTRRWPCQWIVDMTCSGGPIFGPFRSRWVAVRCEAAWLERVVSEKGW